MSDHQGAPIIDSPASPSNPCSSYSLQLLVHFAALYSRGESTWNECFYECLRYRLVEQSKKGLGKGVNILRSSRWLMIMVLEDCARRASLVKLGKIGEQPRQKVGILTSESRGLR